MPSHTAAVRAGSESVGWDEPFRAQNRIQVKVGASISKNFAAPERYPQKIGMLLRG
jgi:hypothetical protein